MAYIIGLLIIVPIIGLCLALMYILAKPNQQRPAEAPLTPRDLQVLQESAEELVGSITSAADRSLERFEEARTRLEELVVRAEKAAEFLESRLEQPSEPRDERIDRLHEAFDLKEAGMQASDIARKLDMGAGEVELLLNLRPRLQTAKSA